MRNFNSNNFAFRPTSIGQPHFKIYKLVPVEVEEYQEQAVVTKKRLKL